MNYKISHTTTYAYSEPVGVCHNIVRLTPREDTYVRCRSHRLAIRPVPQITGRRKDYFGNQIHTFSIDESHRTMTVTASSRVTVEPTILPQSDASLPWEKVRNGILQRSDADWFDMCPYIYNSPRIVRSELFCDYAYGSFSPGRPILDAALDLTARIHQEFAYDTTATNVSTPTEHAFLIKRGVCQDFAHVQLATLRSIGLPARYVSGYLRTIPPANEPPLVGADQSHAWVALFCGPLGWVDLDPTNNLICSTDHIPVAWGRDYDDVVPIRGVFLGGGMHEVRVSVDVIPIDDDESHED